MNLSELLTSSFRLTLDEAVALVLAVEAHLGHSGDAQPGVPPLEHVWLDASGRVTLTTAAEPAVQSERMRQLASLLHTLLALDAPAEGPRLHVPGALVLLMARAQGKIDLAPPSYTEFTEALRRHGAGDAATIAAIHRRRLGAPAIVDANMRSGRRERGHTKTRLAVAAAMAAGVMLVTALSVSRIDPADVAPDRASDRTIASPAPETTAADATSVVPPPVPKRRSPAALVEAERVLARGLLDADAFSPSYDQHGRELLFHVGRSGGTLMRASLSDTGQPRVAVVVADRAANYHPAASPNGDWLAYDSDRDGTRGVYVARADGTGAARVSGDGYAAVPRWSPDGRRLAFVRADGGRPRTWNVWVLDLQTRALSQVSHHRIGQAWSASWFPDGDRVAYSVEDRLVMTRLQGGDTQVVRSPLRGHLIRTPAVSPDGTSVVFQVHRDGIWLLTVATGAMHRLVADPAAEEFAWAPDGREVVYHTRRDGGWGLWRMVLPPGLG